MAVIGAGYWGANLIRCAAGHEGVRLTKVVEMDPRRAQEVGRLYPGVEITSDLDEVLRGDRVDAFLVATPASTHHAILDRIVDSCRGVYVEKPLALDADTFASVSRRALQRGCVVQVGYLYAFNPLVMQARDALQSGIIGDPLFLTAQRLNYGPVRLDVSPVMDLMVHDLSIAKCLGLPRIRSVSARSQSWLGESQPDYVECMAEMGDIVAGTLTASWLHPFKARQFVLQGSVGAIFIDEMAPAGNVIVFERDGLPDYRSDVITDFESFKTTIKSVARRDTGRSDHRESLKLSLGSFFADVENGRPSRVGMDFAMEIEHDARMIEGAIRREGDRR